MATDYEIIAGFKVPKRDKRDRSDCRKPGFSPSNWRYSTEPYTLSLYMGLEAHFDYRYQIEGGECEVQFIRATIVGLDGSRTEVPLDAFRQVDLSDHELEAAQLELDDADKCAAELAYDARKEAL